MLLISPMLADGFVPLAAEPELADRYQLIRYHKRGWVGSTHTAGRVSIEEHAETYSVVSVRGEVDLHTAPKLQQAIERAAETSGAVVVVDMSGVGFMDSTALSALVRSKETLDEKAALLRLVAPSRAVQRIFSVTGLGDLFDIFPSREAALPEP